MIYQIKNLTEFNTSINDNRALLIYFSHDNCSVCKVLKPKIHELLTTQFPLMTMHYCDTIESPDVAAQNSVFTVPTILVFLDGKEFIRKSRSIGIAELHNIIERPYLLMFTE
ncbi:MAG: thiol reductase thioredoxin [Bacteroidetes bacterium GWF2_33_16]|nr:MAG: thiol reductase thioredoxin [Bacteroidetes bacterium GWE2_32_14]OFY07840.1 MAG: thiol reductase thioredoxin [Bacteroidetes bacterium GWF2_33_16]